MKIMVCNLGCHYIDILLPYHSNAQHTGKKNSNRDLFSTKTPVVVDLLNNHHVLSQKHFGIYVDRVLVSSGTAMIVVSRHETIESKASVLPVENYFP